MAVTVTLERIRGSEDNPSRSYYVEDDAGAAVTEDAAIAAVAAVAPASIRGAEALASMQTNQLTDYAWRCVQPYSLRQLRPLTPLGTGQTVDGCQFRAKAFRYFDGTPFATEPTGAPSLEGLVGLKAVGQDTEHQGYLVTPPSIARFRRITLTNTQVSSTYVSLVESMCVDPGTVNSAPIFGRAAGQVCLVAANLTQSSDDTFSAYFGFGFRTNRTIDVNGETMNLNGFDFVQYLRRKKTITIAGKKVITPTVAAAYQYRPQNYADLNTLFP